MTVQRAAAIGLHAKDEVFHLQLVDDVLLVSIDPAGEDEDQELEAWWHAGQVSSAS